MQLNIKNLYDGLGTGALADTYTAPTGTKAVLKSVTLCNSTAGVVACTIKLMPRTAGTLRTLISARNLAVNETYTCPEVINHILEAGGKIQLLGLNVELVISGVEIVQ